MEPEQGSAQVAAAALSAQQRIAGLVRRTPLEPSPWLSEEVGAEVLVKLENHQATGSFKLRGASNKAALASAAGARELVTASSGNHGLALAHAARALPGGALRVTVFAPLVADAGKLQAIRRTGASVVQAGEDCIEAEAAARCEADVRGAVYVSPYNDHEVIAGQATLGLELLEQLPTLATVYLALGGGGLCGGVGSVLRQRAAGEGSAIEVVACSPQASAVMVHSLAAGEILDLPSLPTLSDGTAGGVEAGSLTFPLCREVITRSVLVGEGEIAHSLRQVIAQHHTLIEGAAAAAVAGLRQDARRGAQVRGPVVVVLCGANIAPEVLRRVLDE